MFHNPITVEVCDLGAGLLGRSSLKRKKAYYK
jgi:hypothetical protein